MVRRKPTHRTRLRRLVRVLRGLQRNERLTIEDMALRLGISTSMLGMVYSGRGAATDIIVASAKAYMNALNRLLAAKGKE